MGWLKIYEENVVISVEHVNLDVSVPKDEVRMVAMQPFIIFPEEDVEPFQWRPDAVPHQLEGIVRTLELGRSGFSGRGANFTVFPEYALPGREGVALVDDAVCSGEWPANSVVIGGVDGLSKADYQQLCGDFGLRYANGNSPDYVEDNQWVNCCIIWVKDVQGSVAKWVQLKIRPAWPELSVSCNDMFRGRSVYVFKALYAPSSYPCRFVTLICFDWIASVAGRTVCDEVIKGLGHGLGEPIPLHWVFVIQHNKGPNKPSFLNSTYRFFTDGAYPMVERDRAVVLHANSAVAPRPARSGDGAFSACILSPSVQVDCRACRPTVCMQPLALRANPALEKCHDVVFREMGECIHAFSIRVPKFITPDVTDRTYPLTYAAVYPAAPTEDARLPGDQVPASVKWVNDTLDTIPLVSEAAFGKSPLKSEAMMAEESITTSLRKRKGHSATHTVNWATCSDLGGNGSRVGPRLQNADMWDEIESAALKHVLFSLTALGLAYSLDCNGTVLHATVESDNGHVQVVAIRGETHQDCRKHLDDLIQGGSNDPVLLISADYENLKPLPEEYARLDETSAEMDLAFYDYHSLMDTCRNATSSDDLKGKLDGILPGLRRII